MRMLRNTLVPLLGLFTVLAPALMAQDESGQSITKFISETEDPTGLSPRARPLDPTEILLRLGRQIETTDLDCSHFVQSLFERAGLYYDYAPSRALYAGMSGFHRVYEPEPGDLIVWPGHVGIVIDPDEETFLSALRTGVKTSTYTSRYWKRRGTPHFFRYLPGAENPQTQPPQTVAGRRADAASGAD
jgi:NlpC/P60 family